MPRTISFDVLGTCFGFDGVIDVVHSRLNAQILGPRGIDPKTLVHLWFFAAQRDFTYASLAGQYVPIASVLKATFRRACAVVDVPLQAIKDDDVEAVMAAVRGLTARPGLKRAFDGLREAGWDVYGVTNGAKEASLKYYELADVQLDAEHLISCDDIRVAKPDIKVYENAKRILAERSGGNDERWFVAAHAWDLMAAREAGFKTAYLAFEEHDPVTEVFGKFDVYAETFDEFLEKMKKF